MGSRVRRVIGLVVAGFLLPVGVPGLRAAPLIPPAVPVAPVGAVSVPIALGVDAVPAPARPAEPVSSGPPASAPSAREALPSPFVPVPVIPASASFQLVFSIDG